MGAALRPAGALGPADRHLAADAALLVVGGTGQRPELANLIGWMALFAIGAIAMRGAGCTWNDIVDRKIDARVERTRGRPLPAGEVKLRDAVIWMALQSLVGVAILFKLNKSAGGVALLSVALIAIYPTMKRFTSWPQAVLGLAFNWGALVGYAAVTGTLSWATVALYGAASPGRWSTTRSTPCRTSATIRSSACARPRGTSATSRGAGSRCLPARRCLLGHRRHLATCSRSTSRPGRDRAALRLADRLPQARRSGRLPGQVQVERAGRPAADGSDRRGAPALMARLPVDPEGFIRANLALERPAMVPEFRLWLATEYVPIWQATEAWMEQQNIDPPYWAFCWPGGQAIARYLLDNPGMVRGKRVIDFAAGSGVSSMAAAHSGAASVTANDIDLLSLVAARLNAEANGLAFEVSADDWLANPDHAPEADVVIAGDVCYEREMSVRALAWLRSHANARTDGAARRPRPQLFLRAGARGTGALPRSRLRCSSKIVACARPSYGGCFRRDPDAGEQGNDDFRFARSPSEAPGSAYERDIPESLKRLAGGFAPQLVFDVGAFRGDFASSALAIWPTAKIACFEPLPHGRAQIETLRRRLPNIAITPPCSAPAK